MTDPDTDRILNAVENNSRANIIADLVGHPDSMPTRKELEHMNPSIEQTHLSTHLDTLVDVGVVECIETDQHRFYTLTTHARTTFDEHNLFDKPTYQSAYEEVSKPPEIQELETLDRTSLSDA